MKTRHRRRIRQPMTKHSQPTDCLKFLEETNSASEKKIIARFGNALEHGCLDEYLNIFTRYFFLISTFK